MTEPLTSYERAGLLAWAVADRDTTPWPATAIGTKILRLLDDLERAEAERDEWRDVAKCEGENEAHERELVMRAEKAERERDEARAKLARIVAWVLLRQPVTDHGCSECVPGGHIVIPGFRCGWHEALAIAKGDR